MTAIIKDLINEHKIEWIKENVSSVQYCCDQMTMELSGDVLSCFYFEDGKYGIRIIHKDCCSPDRVQITTCPFCGATL